MLGSSGYARGKSNGREKQLPSIPAHNHSPNLDPPNNQPRYSTVSSIYSQPSPGIRQKPYLEIPRASSVYPDDISPPDSPSTTGGKSASPNVSPISNTGSGSFRSRIPPRLHGSSIPLPSQQQHSTGTSYVSGWKEKVGVNSSFGKERKTKWDSYSGEPTSSEKGKEGSATPGTTPFDKVPGMGTTSIITSTQPPKENRFASTFRKVRKEVASTQHREEWKGSSGRHAIVPTPADKPSPSGKSKSFPTPSQRRMQGGLRQAAGLRLHREPAIVENEKESAAPTPRGKRTPSRDLGNSAERTYSHPQEQNSRGSIVSPEPPRLDTELEFEDRAKYAPSPLSGQVRTQEIVHNPGPIIKGEAIVQTPDRVDTPPRFNTHFNESQLRRAVQNMDLDNEPGSRFSGTTYNTTIPDSPPGTPDLSKEDVPPVPVPPLNSSILNRKRPVPQSGVNFNSKPPTRKPTPSANGARQERDDKDLPSAPPQEEPVDRVTLLEAKLASLQKRKTSIETVIHELTEVVQPSSISYDISSRQEIKKTVAALNAESAVIAKEMHETGLKLHRAMKKRDEASYYEPTGLWVRRVTE